jgi:hypothetical protein
MKPFALACLVLFFAVAIFSPSAQAFTNGIAWVGLNGNDSNNCGIQTTPCATLSGAYAQLGPGGTISCIDNAASFLTSATFTITHSIAIDCRGGPFLMVASSVDFLTVNTGPNDVVILRGLEFESLEITGFTPGLTGIKMVGGGTLHVENCTFRNFTTAGIQFVPNSAAKLFVADSTFQHNAAGVLIKPTTGGFATASFDRVSITENTGGGLKSDTTTSGPITVDISNSSISYNAGNGLNAVSGAGGANMMNLSHDVISSNGSAGVQVNGGNAAAGVDTTLLDSNVAGSTTVINGGRLLTYGNNRVVGTAGSGFTGPAPLQ